MYLGYNTNGFACHGLSDAVAILSELGYESVALTLECGHLDPADRTGVPECLERLRPVFKAVDMHVTIETGSRFILDPRHKHQPTLLSSSPQERRRRVEFLKAAVDVASAMSADSVSLWSGAPDDDATEVQLLDRLTTGLGEVLEHAEAGGIRLAFEPEPGMFIDTMARFEKLHASLPHPLLGLTLDVGHIHCQSDGDVRQHVRRWRDVLWNVHIEDMRRGEHNHLIFGDGDMDFGLVFGVLDEIDYGGPVHVELSRHSHDAVEAARRSFEFLRPYLQGDPT